MDGLKIFAVSQTVRIFFISNLSTRNKTSVIGALVCQYLNITSAYTPQCSILKKATKISERHEVTEEMEEQTDAWATATSNDPDGYGQENII